MSKELVITFDLTTKDAVLAEIPVGSAFHVVEISEGVWEIDGQEFLNIMKNHLFTAPTETLLDDAVVTWNLRQDPDVSTFSINPDESMTHVSEGTDITLEPLGKYWNIVHDLIDTTSGIFSQTFAEFKATPLTDIIHIGTVKEGHLRALQVHSCIQCSKLPLEAWTGIGGSQSTYHAMAADAHQKHKDLVKL